MTQPDNNTQQHDEAAAGGEVVPAADDPRNAESAKWRHRAKQERQGREVAHVMLGKFDERITEVEAELEGARRQLVEHHVRNQLHEPVDIWRNDSSIPLTDDGQVDLGAIDARLATLTAEHRHLRRGPGAAPASAVRTTASGDSWWENRPKPEPEKPTWQDKLQGRDKKK